MRKFLKFMLVVAVVAMICVLSYAGKYYMDDKEDTSSNGNSVNNVTVNQNKVNIDNNKIDENVVEENKDNENKTEGEDNKKEPTVEEVSLSNDEKAIELAKKEYGTTDGVYFRIEQMQSNTVYIVSVRDTETTRDLAWYTVDVKNETVKQ